MAIPVHVHEKDVYKRQMSKRQYPLIYAKVPACLMHIAAVIIALIGISLMYLNNNFGKGLESLSIESYEDTPGFYEQLRRDVNDIFKYVRYRHVFETDGKICLLYTSRCV